MTLKQLRHLMAVVVLTAMAASPAAARQTVKFTSAGGVTGFGYYVGQYQGVLVSSPGQPTIDLYCVDFLHRVHLGQVWSANITSLSGNLGTTRGGVGAYDLYLRAAWLAGQYITTPTSEWKNIQATIWKLFYAGSPTPTNGSYWLNLANQNYSTVNPNYWHVVTDVNKTDPGSVQEFLTYASPEPSTYALFATGLLLIGWFALRRRPEAFGLGD